MGSSGQGRECQGAMPPKELGAGEGLSWRVPACPGPAVCGRGAVLGLRSSSARSAHARAGAVHVLQHALALCWREDWWALHRCGGSRHARGSRGSRERVCVVQVQGERSQEAGGPGDRRLETAKCRAHHKKKGERMIAKLKWRASGLGLWTAWVIPDKLFSFWITSF